MSTSAKTIRPLTGRFVLFALIGFFAIVMGANGIMMRFAISTLPGTEVDSAYSASLAYQREIAAAQQQNARRWQVDAHIERGTDGAASLDISARDRDGTALTGLTFTGRLERPTDRRGDRVFEVTERSGGNYRGSTQGIASGQWDLVIEGDSGGQRLFLSKNRVVLN
ncbi:FixH family protein [Bradyrhizobium jicamae]|uniref:FixH family protein n=1 Tax=Bradyrhizobium jicamae TaxID=280332 RepID=UPI001BA787D7|nr:FixH family protein [Bradyrhizobium jicamae]MBR0752381.1 FixH family protein [Bradyrhizobium jicamae]